MGKESCECVTCNCDPCECVPEKRNIRANLLAARKIQLQRKKRGYGKLPKSLLK
jgi:hypothetical protein